MFIFPSSTDDVSKFLSGQGENLALVALMEVWYTSLLFVKRSAFQQTSLKLTQFACSWLSGIAIPDRGKVFMVKQVFSITGHASKVSYEYLQFAIKFCIFGSGIHYKDFEHNLAPAPFCLPILWKARVLTTRPFHSAYAKIFRNLASNSIRNCVMAL